MFQLPEYLLEHTPELAGFLARHTNELLAAFPSLQDFLLMSGLLLSIAETLLML